MCYQPPNTNRHIIPDTEGIESFQLAPVLAKQTQSGLAPGTSLGVRKADFKEFRLNRQTE